MDVQEIVEIECYTPKSVKKSMDESRKRLHYPSFSAKQREEQGNLICSVCSKIVDHSRHGSIDRHQLTETHKKNKSKKKVKFHLKPR